jgi:KDO2-lipid IV(A) lauroyltransferase
MRKLRHLLEAIVFGVLLKVTRILPRRFMRWLGRFIGRLTGRLNRRHQKIALSNLQAAMPELSEVRRLEISRKCWSHFGEILLDTLCFHRFGPESVGRVVRYRGLQHLQKAYEQGKGVLLFSGHFGHWELNTLIQGYLGMPIALVARPLDNNYLEKMLASLRGASGNSIIYKRNAVRAMVKALRSGIGAGIMIDQDARDSGVFVPFFGRPASTTPTLALLAIRTAAPVIPMHSVPGQDGSWVVTYGPPVHVNSEAEREEEVLRLTAHCTSILEGWIRERPELWLWMHRRWKTVPAECETGTTVEGEIRHGSA